MTLNCVVISLFFFQAEDGIRDHCVTGVQTCALPISGAEVERLLLQHRAHALGSNADTESMVSWNLPSRSMNCVRSEERRVGKSVDRGGRRISRKKKKQEQRGRITIVVARAISASVQM